MIILKFFSAWLRRVLGGWLSDIDIIKERGVQWVIGILLYSLVIWEKSAWLGGYNTFLYEWLPLWVFIPLGSFFVVLGMTSGHFPSFLCSTESKEYIEEQLANGREIKYQKFVDWLGEKRGFEQFGTEWCFWHLMLCKVIACIIPAFFFGSQFLIVGALVAFAYNAMFWVKLKPFGQYLSSPTNFGEFIHGWFIMSALL